MQAGIIKDLNKFDFESLILTVMRQFFFVLLLLVSAFANAQTDSAMQAQYQSAISKLKEGDASAASF
jgi:hypothetical protein